MPRLLVGDTNLHVERHGAGFPVVFISGLSGLASYWQPQVAGFAKRYELVLHDHRGVGRSDEAKRRASIERMAEDVVSFMDALKIERAHLVGHSSGGCIAQSLAIDHPERIACLVIAAGWSKPDAAFRRQFALRRQMLKAIGPEAYVQLNTVLGYPPDWANANDAALVRYEAEMVANFAPAETMLARIDALLAFDREAELGRISAASLIVASADDQVAPIYQSEALARAIPNAEFKLLSRGGHCLTQVSAREFALAVLPFLDAHTPATAAAPAA